MISPSISVIIPTYGREAVLCETLANVLQQDYPNYEVLVIDQTAQHEPETDSYLEKLATGQQIRYYRVRWASLPGARNYGVRRATGEIIVFLDDDVLLPVGFLTAHAANYQRSTIGAVAGRIFDRTKLAEADPDLVIDTLPAEAMNPAVAWYHLNLVHTRKPQQVITARGCNMSFRRELFEKYDLWFDERFQGSAVREESDFCLRIRQTPYQIWYDPQAHLVHLGEESGGCHDLSTRSFKYQITFYHNNFLMLLKNLSLWQVMHSSANLFSYHVLGLPPYRKNGSPIAILIRAFFYVFGFLAAVKSISIGNDGQVFTKQDELSNEPFAQSAVHPLLTK